MSWDLIGIAVEGLWWGLIAVWCLLALAGWLWSLRPWRDATEARRQERWRDDFYRSTLRRVEDAQMKDVEASGPVWRPDPAKLPERPKGRGRSR